MDDGGSKNIRIGHNDLEWFELLTKLYIHYLSFPTKDFNQFTIEFYLFTRLKG